MSDSPLTPSIDDEAAMASTQLAAMQQRPEGDPDNEDWQRLSPRWITVERISGWIVALVVAAVGAVVVGVTVLNNWPFGWQGLGWPGRVLIVGYVVVAVGLLIIAHVLPAIAYRHTRYRLSDVGFEIQRGIFWRSSIIVPHNRVQHTDVAQGPLQRPFDLGKLIIYTAGTQNASVELDGLEFQTAGDLRDALVGRPEGTDGV